MERAEFSSFERVKNYSTRLYTWDTRHVHVYTNLLFFADLYTPRHSTLERVEACT